MTMRHVMAALSMARRQQGMADGGDPISYAGMPGMQGTPSGAAPEDPMAAFARRTYENDVISRSTPDERGDYYDWIASRRNPPVRPMPRQGLKGTPLGPYVGLNPDQRDILQAMQLMRPQENPFRYPAGDAHVGSAHAGRTPAMPIPDYTLLPDEHPSDDEGFFLGIPRNDDADVLRAGKWQDADVERAIYGLLNSARAAGVRIG
jgi:hypothetical protein